MFKFPHEAMYQSEVETYKRGSHNALSEYRARKFFDSWKGKTIVYALLPLWILSHTKRKSISIILAFGFITSSIGIYA